MKSQWSGSVGQICTKFDSNPSSRFPDISFWTKNVNHMVALVIRIQPWMTVQHFAPIHPLDVKQFYWKSENIDLLVAAEEKSENHQSP